MASLDPYGVRLTRGWAKLERLLQALRTRTHTIEPDLRGATGRVTVVVDEGGDRPLRKTYEGDGLAGAFERAVDDVETWPKAVSLRLSDRPPGAPAPRRRLESVP